MCQLSPYLIDLGFFDLTVLEYALSEKSIFISIVTLEKNDWTLQF